MATKRNFKCFEERFNGHVLRAHVVDTDADGFGTIKEWHALKDGVIVHTDATNFKCRRWIKAQKVVAMHIGEVVAPTRKPRTKRATAETAQEVRAVPKPSQIKRRTAKGPKFTFPQAIPEASTPEAI